MPTLYHDLVHHPRFAASDVSSVRKLGFAGAPMTDGLLKELQAAFRPDLFVNHYGSSEVYTFTIDQNAPAKPGSAGRAGINQMVRVVKLGARSVDDIAAAGEEGEIIALLAGDESFEGYWRRPDADAKALRQGWYFTGDTGFIDARRRPVRHRPGRRHDHHRRRECLAGRDRDPACRCTPPSSEVAVVGLPDERWGKIVAAFIKRRAAVEPDELDAFCRTSGLANFKRPRRYMFVEEIPKSPVGKLLRRKLVAGEYAIEPAAEPRGSKEPPHEHLFRSAFADPRRFPRRDRCRPRTRRRGARPAAAQRHRNGRARPASPRLRGARRGCARARDRAAGGRPAFFQRRQYRGFSAASPEHVSKLAWNIAAPARCSKPVIVANRGYCFGVGFEISLACDFRLVSETCQYALPEQRLGQIPGSGGSARLQKIIGITRTKDIVMRSKRIAAKQAYEWGIATECVPDDKLEAATDALVEELRAFSPLAQRTAKTLLNETEDTNLEAAIELEGHCYSRLRQSDDFREGVEAFHAKRKAVFRGS